MAQRLLSLLLLILVPTFTLAQTELREQTATGYGDNYQEALAAALFNAANQVKGLTVHSEKQLRADIRKVIEGDKTVVEGSLGVEQKIFTLTKGLIDSYSVSKVREPSGQDGTWAVTVNAKVPYHTTSVAEDTRKRVAIMPFRFAHATFALDPEGPQSSGYQLAQKMRDHILTRLTQGQQVIVLNRAFNSELTGEQALLSSSQVPPAEAARLGQVAGADYILVGNIHKLHTKAETKEFYGMRKTTFTDHVDLTYQLIEVASSKVEWADTLQTKLTREPDASTDHTLDTIGERVSNNLLAFLSGEPVPFVKDKEDKHKMSDKAVRATPGSSEAPIRW